MRLTTPPAFMAGLAAAAVPVAGFASTTTSCDGVVIVDPDNTDGDPLGDRIIVGTTIANGAVKIDGGTQVALQKGGGVDPAAGAVGGPSISSGAAVRSALAVTGAGSSLTLQATGRARPRTSASARAASSPAAA